MSLDDDDRTDLEQQIIQLRQEITDMRDDFNEQLNKKLNAIVWQEYVKNIRDEMTDLDKRIPHKIVFQEHFPTTYLMVRGQLIHNKPQPGGKPGGFRPSEWRLKLGFWVHDDDVVKYPDGTMEPMYFNLSSVTNAKPKDPKSLFAQTVAAHLDEQQVQLIGCRAIKGMGKAKGTRLIEDQVVAISPPLSDNKYADRTLVVWEGDVRLRLTEPLIITDRDPFVAMWTKKFD